jgi:hypothetical protein
MKKKNLFIFMNLAIIPQERPNSSPNERVLLYPKGKNTSGIDFYGYFINDQYGYLLNDIALWTNKKYNAVRQAFLRGKNNYNEINKKYFLEEGIHYVEKKFDEIEVSDKLSHTSKYFGGNYIIILQKGLFLLLSKMSGEFNDAILYELNNFYWDTQLRKRKEHLRPKNYLKLPDFPYSHRSKSGHLVDSRGEQIIADILYDLDIPYQPGKYFYEYSINVDFILIGEPLTVIEYWGLDTANYKENRERKHKIYAKLNWKCIDIEKSEVDNSPKLKERLKKILGE